MTLVIGGGERGFGGKRSLGSQSGQWRGLVSTLKGIRVKYQFEVIQSLPSSVLPLPLSEGNLRDNYGWSDIYTFIQPD